MHRRECAVNGILVEDKMRRFKGECAHFSLNKCPIYTHGSANDFFKALTHTKRITIVMPILADERRGGGGGANEPRFISILIPRAEHKCTWD